MASKSDGNEKLTQKLPQGFMSINNDFKVYIIIEVE